MSQTDSAPPTPDSHKFHPWKSDGSVLSAIQAEPANSARPKPESGANPDPLADAQQSNLPSRDESRKECQQKTVSQQLLAHPEEVELSSGEVLHSHRDIATSGKEPDIKFDEMSLPQGYPWFYDWLFYGIINLVIA